MTVEELVAELAKADQAEVVQMLQTKAHPLWQGIFNQGHSTATAQAKKDREKVETDLQAANAAVEKAKADIAKLEEKAPDMAKLRTQYETQIQELQQKLKAAEDGVSGIKRETTLEMQLKELQSKLIAAKVHPRIAKIVISDKEIRDRLTINDDGSVTVKQHGKDIPMVVASGQDVLDALATEIAGGLGPELLSGSGDRGTGLTGGSPAKGSSAFFDQIRKDAMEERKVTEKPKPATERLGMTSTT